MARSRPRAAAVAFLVFALAVPLMVEPAAAAPSASLSPSSGAVGTVVSVTGGGFTPGFPPCEVRFGGTKVANCTVNANGGVGVSINVPSRPPGSYTVQICNYCGGGEFQELATRTFTITPNPTSSTSSTSSSTSTSTTSTTLTPGSSTSSSTSTSTTSTTLTPGSSTSTTSSTTSIVPLPVPLLIEGEAIPQVTPGAGVPNLSAGSPLAQQLGAPWQPISVVAGEIRLPEVLLNRCGTTHRSHVLDFDDQSERSRASFDNSGGLGVGGGFGLVAAPELGTHTAPHAVATEVPVYPNSSATPYVFHREGFTYVGMTVGLAEPQVGPVIVELGARPAYLEVVDVDRVLLDADAGPATTCIVVAAPPGERFETGLLRAYVDAPDGTAAPLSVPLHIDHIFWSTDETYPIPSEVEAAEVEILYPPEGQRLRTTGTGVIGRVRYPAGIHFSGIDVASPSWDASSVITRRASVGAATVEGADATRLFWVDRIDVPPRDFRIAASTRGTLAGGTSVDVSGVGRPTPSADTYRDLAEGQVDVVPWSMEVTQAIRGPLVAQEPGSSIDDAFKHVAGKRTVVRGYAVQHIDGEEPTGQRLQVDAVLHGTRNGVTLPFSPLVPELVPVPIADREPGPAAEELARPAASNTLNFVLPNTWTAAGAVDLRMEVNPTDSMWHVDEPAAVAGASNSIARRVSFANVGRVGVTAAAVDLHWQCTQDRIDAARDNERTWDPCHDAAVDEIVSDVASRGDVEWLVRDWWRMLPAAGDAPAYLNFATVALRHEYDDFDHGRIPAPQMTGDTSIASLGTWREAFYDVSCGGPEVDRTIIRPPSMRDLVMFVTPRQGPVRGGCAWRGDLSAFRTNLVGSTAAQEAAHTMGLKHSSNAHGEADGGTALERFAGDHGELSHPAQKAWGFDTASMSVIHPAWRGHAHDYMSYGGGATWTSYDTWLSTMQALVENRPISDARNELYASGSGDSSSGEGEGRPGPGSADAGGEVLVVEGFVEDGTVTLGTMRLSPAGAVATAGDDAAVLVELLDADGAAVGSARAALSEVGTHGGLGNQWFIAELPAGRGHEQVRVSVEGLEPIVLHAEPDAGRVEIIELPEGGDGAVRWESDVEGPFLVEASDDDGASWWPLGSTDDRSLEIDGELLSLQGPGWKVRVQAQHGAGVASAISDAVDLGVRAPTARIGFPADGSWHTPGMLATTATAGGIGDDATYRWSVDGEVWNEGRTAEVPLLTEGARTIELTVTNEAGSSTHEITVEVGEDQDADGFVDRWEERVGLDPSVVDEAGEDPDEDGLPTGREYELGTDPQEADTDGDGFSDGLEVSGAGDPLDSEIIPGPVHGVDDGLDAEAALAPDVEAEAEGGSSGALAGAVALVLVAGGGAALALRARRRPTSDE